MAQGTFTLVAEATQGDVVIEHDVPSANPTIAHIAMQSTDFGANAALSFELLIEESFDGGASYVPASGFPSAALGGDAGKPSRDGGISTGLPSWEYAYDGRARRLRVSMTPSIPFDWGLTVTLQ
jgi:hypothetical protein